MVKKESVAVILPAGGLGKRMGASLPKAFISVAGKTLLEHTLGCFYRLESVSRIIIPVPAHMVEPATKLLSTYTDKPVVVVEGGAERLHSIHKALQLTNDEALIAVHDAVRPLVSQRDIERVFAAAQTYDAAMLVSPSDNTLKKVSPGMMVETTIDRSEVWQAQTPQVFSRALLKEAYEQALEASFLGTDDASLVERIGGRVKAVEGSRGNIKITRREDLAYFEYMMNLQNKPVRIGYGYDIHRLKEGRPLILGGEDVAFEKGLDGHSDADVLIHAIIDAILGALAMGDIGSHFPDTDAAYKGADSRVLLRRVHELMTEKGYYIGNIDATVVAQRPRLRDFIDPMRNNVSADLNVAIDDVSVKATTSEKIGFVGREEGMSASAVVLLYKSETV